MLSEYTHCNFCICVVASDPGFFDVVLPQVEPQTVQVLQVVTFAAVRQRQRAGGRREETYAARNPHLSKCSALQNVKVGSEVWPMKEIVSQVLVST